MKNFCSEELIKELFDSKVIPVLVAPTVESGVKVCELLYKYSLKVAEITFRTAAAETVIREVRKLFPDMIVGAGTVLNTVDLRKSQDSGAKFAVAPGFNARVVEEAVRIGMPFFPGVATPSEIESALELGCRILKFFPAESLGGVKMLKAISAPYKHLDVKYIPLGGVNIENMSEYFKMSEVLAVGGTWLATAEQMKAGDWGGIEKNIKELSVKLDSIRAKN